MKLVKFYADWCGPCKQLSVVMNEPRFKEIFPTWEEVDIEKNVERAQALNIVSLPTLILFRDNGEEITRVIGNTTVDRLLARLKEH